MFFLSYARVDGEANAYFEKFKRELFDELVAQGTRSPKALCFLDSDSIQLGAPWQEEIETALRTCHSFVAMLSPNYIEREACGLEWSAFTSRLGSAGSPQLLPIQWAPVEGKLPPEIARHQFKHDSLGQRYAEKGMRHLFRMEEDLEWKNAVSALAARIVAAENAGSTAAGPLATSDLKPAFGGVAATGIQAQPAGPKWVDFIIVAGRANELSHSLHYYGNDPDDWSPYTPQITRIAVELQNLATKEGKTATITPVTRDLIANIRAAAKNNRIIIIVIDAWTLEIERYAEVMRQYDELAKVHCAAMVVWNAGDQELASNRTRLVDRLRSIFEYKWSIQDPTEFRHDIETLEDFRSHLRQSIARVHNKIFKNPSAEAPAPARAVGTGASSPPRVTGPGP